MKRAKIQESELRRLYKEEDMTLTAISKIYGFATVGSSIQNIKRANVYHLICYQAIKEISKELVISRLIKNGIPIYYD